MNQADERKLDEFMENVCAYIKCGEVHDDIVSELRGHVEDRMEGYMARGMLQRDAMDAALKDMGSANEIGLGLHRAHRPQTDWLFVSMLATYIGVVLLTMYSIDGSASIISRTFYQGLFSSKLFWTLIGLGLAMWASLLDYRRIRPVSKYLWIGTGLLALVDTIIGINVFGTRSLDFGIPVDILGIAPFIIIIALAGMIEHLDLDRRNDFLRFSALALIPMWLFRNMAPSEIEYSVGLLALLLATESIRKHKGVVVGAGALVLASFCVPFVAYGGLGLRRLQAYLHPQRYAESGGYQYIQGREAINSAGVWGHGLHASLPMLPGIQTNMVFDYVVFAFGWVSALAVVALIITLLTRLMWMSQKTSDRYGRTLVLGLGAMLGVQFIYPVLMAFGIVPMAGMELPLFGTDGWVTMIELASFGLILSVYRRRRMVRASNAMRPRIEAKVE